MEQPKEKKRKVNRKRTTQPKSTSSFPLDLTTEILLRLPARSVLRFRCVSKLWSSITTDSYFIKSFETRFSTLRPSLLVCFKEGDKLFVSSIPQHNHNSNESYSCSQPIYRYHMKFPQGLSTFPPTESVQGLICFQVSGTPIVWNPSKKELLPLPKPPKSGYAIAIFLGYDPVEGKHKVMCMPHSISSDVCWVLTLGSTQDSWRTVKTNHRHRSDYNIVGRCIKGVIYYVADIYNKSVWVIITFDVRFEKFGMIALPTDIFYRDMLINYEGRLAFVERKKRRKSTLWILEDAKIQKWSSSKEFLEPFSYYDKSLKSDFDLKGFTHAGELIYAPSTFHQSFYILFCDPVRESFRRFEFKGITDDESGKGVGKGCVLHTFPNHL
ncbi:F-box domain [Arabidopsis thaliana x Arabidopsis arenosa]|uniref:F-box domain n=1 Tax=Arabidopsis thaliana x Arabidopsis arenosa TaxID=1240361 RepID=A0A8T2C526_9BRAS|nr:F-box domain [Arabidopsis thaliana x Arabidopsis arenosa]